MYANECCVSAATTLLTDMFSVWKVKEVWEKRIFLYLCGFWVFFWPVRIIFKFCGSYNYNLLIKLIILT